MICTTLGHTLRVRASIDSLTRSSASVDALFCGATGTGFGCAVATPDGTASAHAKPTIRNRRVKRAPVIQESSGGEDIGMAGFGEMHFRRGGRSLRFGAAFLPVLRPLAVVFTRRGRHGFGRVLEPGLSGLALQCP